MNHAVNDAVTSAAGLSNPAPSAIAFGVVFAAIAVALVVTCARRDGTAAVILVAVLTLNRPLAHLLKFAHIGQLLGAADDVALGLAFVTMLVARAGGKSAVPRAAWVGFGLFGLMGLVSGLRILHWPPPPVGTAPYKWVILLYGTWLALKLPVSLWVCSRLRWTRRSVKQLYLVTTVILVIDVVASAGEFVDPAPVRRLFGTGGSTDRLGLTSLKGIFDHPAQSSTFLLFALVLFLSSLSGRRRRALIAVTTVLAVLSLRAKTLIDLATVFTLSIVFSSRRVIQGVAPFMVGLVILGVGVGGADLISSRLTSLTASTSPRHALYATSLKIASQGFPWGAGFGRFGSEPSVSHYSSEYISTGLAGLYGFNPANPVFAKDAGWATAIGEAGWLGAAGLLFALVIMWARLLRHMLATRRIAQDRPFETTFTTGAPAFLFLSVFLLDSLASPRLFDGFAAVALGLLYSLRNADLRVRSSDAPEPEEQPARPAPAVPGLISPRNGYSGNDYDILAAEADAPTLDRAVLDSVLNGDGQIRAEEPVESRSES